MELLFIDEQEDGNHIFGKGFILFENSFSLLGCLNLNPPFIPFLSSYSVRYRDCGKQVYLGMISYFFFSELRLFILSEQSLVHNHGYACFSFPSGGFDTAHAAAR